MLRGTVDQLPVTVTRLAFDLRGLAEREAARWNVRAFRHDAADGDDAPLADPRSVHNDGPHANQAIVLDGRPVHDRAMAERHALAERAGKALVGVQDAAVLDVRLPADA